MFSRLKDCRIFFDFSHLCICCKIIYNPISVEPRALDRSCFLMAAPRENFVSQHDIKNVTSVKTPVQNDQKIRRYKQQKLPLKLICTCNLFPALFIFSELFYYEYLAHHIKEPVERSGMWEGCVK